MKTKNTILLVSSLTIALFLSGCNNKKNQVNEPRIQEAKVQAEKNTVESKKVAKLESSLVCFVNNKFMGIKQIPVEVDNKTYYGCCEDCVGKIKNIREVRYAKDPLTHVEVDKALAYIVIAPQGNNDVLYFESEENYLKFNN